jgi:hypothetical protein
VEELTCDENREVGSNLHYKANREFFLIATLDRPDACIEFMIHQDRGLPVPKGRLAKDYTPKGSALLLMNQIAQVMNSAL